MTIYLLTILSILIAFFGNTLGTAQAASVPTTSVVLSIDTSDSMWGTPMNSVKEAASLFISNAPDDLPIAIVTFSNDANVLLDYTTDRYSLLKAIDSLTPGGVTALYDGSMAAIDMAAESDALQKYVILISDGAEYGGASVADRSDALMRARELGIFVHTIGLGFGADRSFLEELALNSNASMYEAPDANKLLAIYDDLSQSVVNTPSIPTQTTVAQTPSMNGVALRSLNDYFPANVDPSATSANDTVTSNQSSPTVIQPLVPENSSTVNAAPMPTNPISSAVVLVIDTSDSMWGTPMTSTKAAAKRFVEKIDGQIPVAIVTFSNTAQQVLAYTTDTASLIETIDTLTPGGVTALYDGSFVGVQLANQAEAEQRVVILLSDGAEYGGQSSADRNDAMILASTQNIQVYTIGLGFGADRTFLEELSIATKGRSFEAPTGSELDAVYDDISEELINAQIISNEGNANTTIAPLDTVDADGLAVLSRIRSELPLIGELEIPNLIAPLNADIAALNLPDSTTTESLETGAPETTLDTTGIITPETLESKPIEPIGNIAPITINVDDADNIKVAELSINNVLLAVFENPPFEFALDTNLLLEGSYRLTFKTINERNVESMGTFDFDVIVSTPAPMPKDAVELRSQNNTVNVAFNTPVEQVIEQNTQTPRNIVVDGQAVNLTLNFNPSTGLLLDTTSAGPIDMVKTQTLGDILSRPINLIPEPIRFELTKSRPELASILIVLMTIILLPQGVFTIFWMTYTWVRPERGEQSRSPREFVKPEFSFTALLPARKEEAVIYHTIQTVNDINYPDHLKEILILIRDEDDDETIAEANRAITDIRRGYEDRGETYPDNVHLVTFKDGPKNKPNGLNRGYKASTKDVICVFDAEDSPHADIYNVINTVMIRDNADVVQSGVQLMNFKSNWFSALNCLEYFFWFKSGLHAFTHALNVTPLGGNTVFFKRMWLDKLAAQDTEKGYRAWDENCLTEDADVGLRLTGLGAKIQIVYDAEHATQEETPDSIEQFIKQRTRWCQGFYEIFFKGDWLKLPTMKQRITAIYILLNSLLQAMIMIFLPIGVYIALTQRIPVPLAMLSWAPIYLLLFQLVINLLGIREFTDAYKMKLPFLFRLKMLMYYYPFQLMLSVSAMRAVFRFLSKNSAWEKTAHSNLHRQTAPVAGT